MHRVGAPGGGDGGVDGGGGGGVVLTAPFPVFYTHTN